jgi:hypothetical protein
MLKDAKVKPPISFGESTAAVFIHQSTKPPSFVQSFQNLNLFLECSNNASQDRFLNLYSKN